MTKYIVSMTHMNGSEFYYGSTENGETISQNADIVNDEAFAKAYGFSNRSAASAFWLEVDKKLSENGVMVSELSIKAIEVKKPIIVFNKGAYISFGSEDDARLYLVEKMLDAAENANGKVSMADFGLVRNDDGKVSHNIVEAFINEGKNVLLAMQECQECGARWRMLYAYTEKHGVRTLDIDPACDCECDYSPMEGVPSISEFGQRAVEYMPKSYSNTPCDCDHCTKGDTCKKKIGYYLSTCVTDFEPNF